MLLLISDANILIDIEFGGLVAPLFSLEYQFAVPDILFYEELDEQHRYLLGMGGLLEPFVTWDWLDRSNPHNASIVCLRKFNSGEKNTTTF